MAIIERQCVHSDVPRDAPDLGTSHLDNGLALLFLGRWYRFPGHCRKLEFYSPKEPVPMALWLQVASKILALRQDHVARKCSLRALIRNLPHPTLVFNTLLRATPLKNMEPSDYRPMRIQNPSNHSIS